MMNSFDHYYERLKRGFIFGSYPKYFQPLNMIKNYYGEKYAFEYAFLIHYQSWLKMPSLLGLLLTFYQIHRFTQTGSLMAALDTPVNAVFGLAVTFWATFFVESWKRKQTTIQFFWGCSDKSFSKTDERSEYFKYYNTFNFRTNQIEKCKQTMKKKNECFYKFMSYLFLCIVLASMVTYQALILGTKAQYDANMEEIPNSQTS